MFKKALIGTLAISLFTSPIAASAAFSDVPSSHIYANSINALQASGCIKGYSDGTYKPNDAINRAEALKLILTCINIPKIYSEEIIQVPKGSSYYLNNNENKVDLDSEIKIKIPFDPTTYPELEFSDVQKGAWYEPIFKEGLVREIITGYTDNTIKPTKTVNKGEFYTMLYRIVPTDLKAKGEIKDVAKDVTKEQWFAESLGFAVDNKLLTLDATGNLAPFKELNRGHVAHFIKQYNDWLNPKIGVTPTTPAATTPTTPESTTPAPATGTTPSTTTPSTTTPSTTTPTGTTPAPTTPVTTTPATVGFTEKGIASYYGTKIAGSKTASGALYDPESLVAAHKTLPFGTIVKVVNPKNNKWVKVSIVDRGPFVEGRILDLSNAAFASIAELSAGVTEVELIVEALPNS